MKRFLLPLMLLAIAAPRSAAQDLKPSKQAEPASSEESSSADEDASGKAVDDFQDLVFLGVEHPYVFRVHVRMDGKNFRDAWTAHTAKFFDELDLNDDGALTIDEAQHIDAQNLVPEKSFFEKLFSAGSKEMPNLPADSNPRDGKVTLDELTAYLLRVGRGPFLTRSNASAGRNLYSGNRGNQNVSEQLRGYIDLDGDKKLSTDELQAANTFLRALDVNDDEIISQNELNSNRNNNNVYRGTVVGQNGQSLFLPIPRDDKRERLAKRLLRKYSKQEEKEDTEGETANVPPALTREELGWKEDFFARFDGDSNGRLDSGELRKYLENPLPAIELIVRRGKKEKSDPWLEVVQTAAAVAPEMKVRTLGDHFITIEFDRDRLELWADRSSGSSSGSNSHQFYERQFDAADRDNNLYLEQKETRRNYYFQSTFKLMDRDGDGKLYKKEMIGWLDQQNEWARHRTVVSAMNRGHDLFDVVDADHDRQLSMRELGHIAERLLRFDRNNDKQIEAGEFPRQLRVMITQDQPSIQGIAVPVPTFSAGASAATRQRKGPRWFQKMDVNNDGDISRREFLGPRDHFKRLDADADGLIDPDEAARFD